MRGSELALSVAGGVAALALARVPAARAELATTARAAHRATPLERLLTGGLVTLRSPGSALIRVPASTFVMGSTPTEILDASASCSRDPLGYRCNEQTFTNELPRRTLRIGSYWLDRTEVTAAEYDRCAARGLCTGRQLAGGAARFGVPNLPATLVNAEEAASYCASRGLRLPHETELERAARGTEGRRYPWGNVYASRSANHGRLGLDATDASDGFTELAPVGSYPSGRTPDGFLDLAGNAAEWTADAYTERYDVPPDPAWGGAQVVRGGHFESGAAWLRSTARTPFAAGERSPFVGFRCARSLDDRPAEVVAPQADAQGPL
jgi:formylglycine-generating enzyme required for sulfatase activity